MQRPYAVVAGLVLVLLVAAPVRAQSSTRNAQGTVASDSAIYAAFFETVNRDPTRDTIFVEAESVVFQGISPHYDSIAPRLGAALVSASAPARPASALHLPGPIQVISPTTPQAVRVRAMDGPPGQSSTATQGTRGVWRFSPIVYSSDGRDAMFYYRLVCGLRCGETAIVWARKSSKGVWELRHTAILSVS